MAKTAAPGKPMDMLPTCSQHVPNILSGQTRNEICCKLCNDFLNQQTLMPFKRLSRDVKRYLLRFSWISHLLHTEGTACLEELTDSSQSNWICLCRVPANPGCIAGASQINTLKIIKIKDRETIVTILTIHGWT